MTERVVLVKLFLGKKWKSGKKEIQLMYNTNGQSCPGGEGKTGMAEGSRVGTHRYRGSGDFCWLH